MSYIQHMQPYGIAAYWGVPAYAVPNTSHTAPYRKVLWGSECNVPDTSHTLKDVKQPEHIYTYSTDILSDTNHIHWHIIYHSHNSTLTYHLTYLGICWQGGRVAATGVGINISLLRLSCEWSTWLTGLPVWSLCMPIDQPTWEEWPQSKSGSHWWYLCYIQV